MTLAELLTGGSVTAASVIWPIMIGVFLAILIAYFNKRSIGKLVQKLLAAPADSEENALSLSDMGLEKRSYIKYALRRGGTLSSIVKMTEDGRYYIPEEQGYRAETTYYPDRSSPLTLIIFGIILIAAGIGLLNVLPYVSEIIGGIF